MYFEKHVFVCTNLRASGAACCAKFGAEEIHQHLKKRLVLANLHGNGRIRINKSGCLDRCSYGPVMVIYPEGIWYQYSSKEDVDEIIDSHLLNGKIVDRLQIATPVEGHAANAI